MGNGLPPTPTNDLGDPIRIDPGTSARTESPPPGPIGLDAKGGTPTQTQPSMASQIVAFPRQHYGERVGDGQCFALADRALRGAGARSADHYGTITGDADYVWGTPVGLADVRAGDVIQFRNYEWLKRVDRDDGSFRVDGGVRPAQRAIVGSFDASGAVMVLELNVKVSPVRRTQIFISSGTFTCRHETSTITVSGTFWFYRAPAR